MTSTLLRPPVSGTVITDVQAIPLRVPFKTAFKFSQGERASAEIVLVRLKADSGHEGMGETQAWRRLGSRETLPGLVSKIENHFAPLLLGRSPFDISAIMSDLENELYDSLYAQAAVSDALYDLQGKILDVPVYHLLGGKCRSSLDMCAPISISASIDKTLDSAQRLIERGFKSLLLKIGIDPRQDVKTVAALRHKFGTDFTLRVDANASLVFDDAVVLLKKLEPYDIDTAEQPLALHDLHGMAELARRIDIPIMVDESVGKASDLINVIRMRAATVVQTKQAKNGGIWRVRKLWDIAGAAGMRIYPGNHPSLGFATAAVAHLGASWPGPLLDGPFAMGVSGELVGDVGVSPLRIEDGTLIVPDGPGLGFIPDEDQIRRYRIDA
ncbi:enolase C-terminal domain-like protein [Roseovarius pacificus]|uniref:mandelate racemase/muconate lactonizing enzyme family protein n=1 Tax=Roseovarius pacificus TaxID=337701 RepID=UPI002A18E2DD|nr:enolase C-terminal domain-like protein [Roseovarius pacificus]